MLEMDEFDNCRLNFPVGISSGDPRLVRRGYVANLLPFFGPFGVLVLIRSKPVISCSLYWSSVSWKLSMDSLSASLTNSEELMISGCSRWRVLGGVFIFSVDLLLVKSLFSRSFCSCLIPISDSSSFLCLRRAFFSSFSFLRVSSEF